MQSCRRFLKRALDNYEAMGQLVEKELFPAQGGARKGMGRCLGHHGAAGAPNRGVCKRAFHHCRPARSGIDIFRGGPGRMLAPNFRDLFDKFDRDMREAFGPNEIFEGGGLRIPVDIEDVGDSYKLTADIPGLSREDVSVRVTSDGVLAVSGERKSETKHTSEGGYQSVERRFGKFRRVVQLPVDADQKSIKAKAEHGVLTIHIGKKEGKEAATTVEIE